MSEALLSRNDIEFVPAAGEKTRVIVASTLGTAFEWYDFYLYIVLAPIFAKLFFPAENDTAALLAAFATYGAGYVIRPLGGVVFGRIGDVEGRKITFLLTIIFMGFATFCVGLLPTFQEIGWLAPVLLIILRLLQGLALGGEYGGAATYIAEYTEPGKRGFATSWIQATATFELIMALGIILVCRTEMSSDEFSRWGWRIPFLLSSGLLLLSVYIRLKLHETPIFQRMKAEGRGTKSPISESFLQLANNRYMLFALLGAVGGVSAVWITGNFYTLFFLTVTLQADYTTAYAIMMLALLANCPVFLFFGWLSDRIGRLKVMLTGCLLAALTFIPLFHGLASAINPALVQFQRETPITVRVDTTTCGVHILIGPWTRFTACDHVADVLTKSGLEFSKIDAPGAEGIVVSIGKQTVDVSGTDKKAITKVLQNELFIAGYPGLRLKAAAAGAQASAGGSIYEPNPANRSDMDLLLAGAILFVLLVYVAMAHAPLGVFLAELFPTRIRYVSMSFPYQIGYGWIGGNVPLVATAIVATTGNIYAGLWYPAIVAIITVFVGIFFLRDNKDQPISR